MQIGADRLALVELFRDLVAEQVYLFAAIDARLRREVGVLLIEVLPMGVIARTHECRVQDIAESLHLSVGGASKSVDRLERDGLASRRVHPTDRRSTIVDLTSAGDRTLDACEAKIQDEMSNRLAILDAEAVHSLATMLRHLRAAAR